MTRRTSRLHALFTAAIALTAGNVHAQIQYVVPPERSILVGGGVPGGTEPMSVAGYLPSNMSLDRQFSNPSPFGPSRGFASHISSLEPSRVKYSGAVGGTDAYGLNQAGSGFGQSIMRLNFRLDTPQNFIFSGNIAALTQSPVANMLVSLRRDGAFSVFDYTTGFGGAVDNRGLLVPGNYLFTATFFAGFSGLNGTGSGSGAWDLTLQIPTPSGVAMLAPLGVLGLRRRR